jgi:hypothetical protein
VKERTITQSDVWRRNENYRKHVNTVYLYLLHLLPYYLFTYTVKRTLSFNTELFIGLTSCKCIISFSRMPTLHTHMVTQWSAPVWTCLLLAGWLLNLLFVPEDGSSMCLRNVPKQAGSYTQSHPTWSCSSLEVKFDALIFYEWVPYNFYAPFVLTFIYLLTPYSLILPEKLTVCLLIKILSIFIEPESPLLCSQEHATGSVLRQVEGSMCGFVTCRSFVSVTNTHTVLERQWVLLCVEETWL